MPTVSDIPVKPCILIADDSRIVRAALIKQIEGMFDFREALDGEQAWEALLLDQSIRVVITDLTMPRLDGYGLLQRIRASRIARIRDIPVVVVSGSDESEERDRARAAGANALITKGIGTAQLLTSLDVLSKLVSRAADVKQEPEAQGSTVHTAPKQDLVTAAVFEAGAHRLLLHARNAHRSFVLLNVAVAMSDSATMLSESVMQAIGQLLQRTVRQTDQVARTAADSYSLAVSGITIGAARAFGERITHAVSAARIDGRESASFTACCGMAVLGEPMLDETLRAIQEKACFRSRLGTERGLSGVIGQAEELALRHGDVPGRTESEPDLATLLQWLRDGRSEDVMPHLGKLSSALQPLVDLLQRSAGR